MFWLFHCFLPPFPFKDILIYHSHICIGFDINGSQAKAMLRVLCCFYSKLKFLKQRTMAQYRQNKQQLWCLFIYLYWLERIHYPGYSLCVSFFLSKHVYRIFFFPNTLFQRICIYVSGFLKLYDLIMFASMVASAKNIKMFIICFLKFKLNSILKKSELYL